MTAERDAEIDPFGDPVDPEVCETFIRPWVWVTLGAIVGFGLGLLL